MQHEVGMGVEDNHAVGGILLQADHLLLQLVAHPLLETEARFVVPRSRTRQDLPAGNVQIARDGHEVHRHLTVLHAVGLLVGSQAPLDGGRLGLGVHARRGADVLDGHAADLGSLLRRHLLHALGQLVEAVAPVLHEVMVVEVLVDDDVQPCHP